MSSYFNEAYYLAAKVKQLSTLPDGKQWTVEEVKAEFAKLGISAEEHYNMFGRAENLNPNAYFNEAEYLAGKLVWLKERPETSAEWAGKSVADLQAEFARIGITPAEHYETWGAFETRADGTLLNPSNAFDANAYFAAKLAQLRASGFEGADNLTVADVVKVFQESGLTPVSHFQLHGANESKTDGVSMAQTVPVIQRMPNDPNRVVMGEVVPGNYNPASAGPAAAVAAPVTKPADVGGLSAAAPAAPAKPLPVPSDSGFVAPPPGLVDTNEAPVLPPTTDKGTGPNAGFIVVDKTTGKGTVIKPDGTIQGTVDVKVDAEGNITPPLPDAPIVNESGNNTNNHPYTDAGDPIVPPNPGGGGTPAPVLQVMYESADPDADPVTYNAVVIKFANSASSVTLTTPDGGTTYVLTPAPGSGTPHTLDAKFTPATGTFKIDRTATLKGTGTDLAGITITEVEAGNAGKVEITDFASTTDLTGISASLHIIADITTDKGYASGSSFDGVNEFKVSAGQSLTSSDVAELSGKIVSGEGDMVLTGGPVSGADAAPTVFNASKFTAKVDATFTEDNSAGSLTFTGGSNGDKLTLTPAATSYANLKAVVDLGAGNDMMVLEGTSAGPAFATGSTFRGGSGDDTLKVTKSNAVTAFASLDGFATDGSGGGFEYLLLESSGAATYDFSAISNKFNAVGFETGSGIYTLQNVDQKVVISNGAASGGSTPVQLALATGVIGNALNLEFKELNALKAKTDQAELSASVDMAAVLDNKTLNVTGSAVNDHLTLNAAPGKFAALTLNAAMGGGNDTVTFDLSQQTGLAFKPGSKIDGGSGINSIAVIGGPFISPFTADFTNVGFTNIATLDVSGVDTTTDALTLNLGNKSAGLTIKGNDTNTNTLIINGQLGVTHTIETGGGNDDVTHTFVSLVSWSALGVNADLGSGNDSLTLDLKTFVNGTLLFASGSKFVGGNGTDTLKLKSNAPIVDGITIDFKDLSMVDVEKLDVSGIDSSPASLRLILSDEATGLDVQGSLTGKAQIWITAKPGVQHTVTTGDGNDTFQYDFVSGSGNNFKASLGSGDDTITLDFGNKMNGHLQFVPGSSLDGGAGTNDSIILKGTLSGDLAFNFSNLELKNVEKLDLNSISGDAVKNRVDITFAEATTLSVTGTSGGTAYMNMGDDNDNITFNSGSGGALTIDTGKGADSITLTVASKSDTIILNKDDYFPAGSGSFTATNLDTIAGFQTEKGGSGTSAYESDKLGVSSFITKGSSLATAPTKGAPAAVADNGIYVIKDISFTNDQVVNATAAFDALFGAGTYFAPTGTATQAVVVVQGYVESYVFYIDSAADGAADFSVDDIAYVAKLSQITSTTGGEFTIGNFA